MRIVSGIYGGRKLTVPQGRDIRPTSDKVRGAIFNALRSRGAVEGAVVLDLFCGTGALGLEALSRGAASCTFIDKARSSVELAKENAAMLGAEGEFIVRDAAKLGMAEERYELVFLDPPYKQGLVMAALEVLYEEGWLAQHAMVVVEAEREFSWPGHQAYALLDERTYKDTAVFYLEYAGVDQSE